MLPFWIQQQMENICLLHGSNPQSIKQTKNNKMDSIKCTNKFPACFPLIKEPTVRRRPCRLLDPTAHGEQSRMYELSTYMLASMVLGRTGGL